MKPAFRYLLLVVVLLACGALLMQCKRRVNATVLPDLTLYEGLGAGAAAEVQRAAPGAGPYLVVAVDPQVLPRYGALVEACKRRLPGETIWHFLAEEQALSFQSDGLGLRTLQELLNKHPGITGVILLGGGCQPGALRLEAAPAVVAGPMDREAARAALAGGPLTAAIVYRDLTGAAANARVSVRFADLFEVLRQDGTP